MSKILTAIICVCALILPSIAKGTTTAEISNSGSYPIIHVHTNTSGGSINIGIYWDTALLCYDVYLDGTFYSYVTDLTMGTLYVDDEERATGSTVIINGRENVSGCGTWTVIDESANDSISVTGCDAAEVVANQDLTGPVDNGGNGGAHVASSHTSVEMEDCYYSLVTSPYGSIGASFSGNCGQSECDTGPNGSSEVDCTGLWDSSDYLGMAVYTYGDGDTVYGSYFPDYFHVASGSDGVTVYCNGCFGAEGVDECDALGTEDCLFTADSGTGSILYVSSGSSDSYEGFDHVYN